ncbi:hypothetical protein CCACVL1_01863 [Corchorus capsularis]|uniref:Uncharacterized protein n=1 Tax=Corchorus capsularis TaxID=210143 RepID=A0A1R3KET2_COCAP|nr:hypothetical protein CCACVL1_01863 [Corchorus capsularis]
MEARQSRANYYAACDTKRKRSNQMLTVIWRATTTKAARSL